MKRAITLLLTIATMSVVLDLSAREASGRKSPETRHKSARSMMLNKNKDKMQPQKETEILEKVSMRKVVSGNETLPSAIIFQGWDEVAEEWYNATKYNYSYVNGVYEQEVVIEIFEGDELLLSERLLYFYNDVWELQELAYYFYNDFSKTWELSAKELTHTDAHGNLVLEASLMYDAVNQAWDTVSGTKYNYTYTAFSQPQQIVVSYYDLFLLDWAADYQEDFSYDSHNRVAEFISYYWDEMENEFVPENREVYAYNNENEWNEVLLYYWFFDNWYLDLMMTDFDWFDFASNKYLSYTAYVQGFETASWEPYFRTTAMYHPVLAEQTYLLDEYYDSWMQAWIPDFRETTEFDENLMPVMYLMEYYFDDDWWMMFGLRNNYVMNVQGYVIENKVEFWDGFITNGWINWMKMLFEYEHLTRVPEKHIVNDMVHLYPNPIADYAYLSMNQQLPLIVVEVLNSQGQVVMSQTYRSYEMNTPVMLNMSVLQPGIYFVKVQSEGLTQMLKAIKK